MNPLLDKNRHKQAWRAIGLVAASLTLLYFPFAILAVIPYLVSLYAKWLTNGEGSYKEWLIDGPDIRFVGVALPTLVSPTAIVPLSFAYPNPFDFPIPFF